jgi:hypothetical protein
LPLARRFKADAGENDSLSDAMLAFSRPYLAPPAVRQFLAPLRQLDYSGLVEPLVEDDAR